MMIRPATAGDVEAARGVLPDLLPDQWRAGGNRRSLVALNRGQVIGHARGIDNAFHPDSRVMVFDVVPRYRNLEVEAALIAAQIAVSDRALHLKIYASMVRERALAHRFGGIAVQATPPWRYRLTAALRAWAASRRTDRVEEPADDDAGELLELMVSHYVAQHTGWSPADPVAVLAGFAGDVDPDSDSRYDPGRSTVLRRGGRVVAAALVWPHDAGPRIAGREVSLICRRHGDPAGRADMEHCLAGTIQRSTGDDVLLIDSHVTEPVESASCVICPAPTRFPVTSG